MGETEELIERLRANAKKASDCLGHLGVTLESTIEHQAADRLAALEGENWQLKQALGYPIPAEFDTPQNPFRCGSCAARSALSPERKEG
jgi:hypothetical protein